MLQNMLQALFGIIIFHLIAWAFSENRRKIHVRVIVSALLIQVVLALIILRIPWIKQAFLGLNGIILALEQATKDGTALVFGFLGGSKLPFDEPYPGAAYILAFRALPLVLVMSALSSLLFYWRILPWIVKGFSWIMVKTMGISGVAGLGSAANVFVGMVEAPLLVRPYLKSISRSDLFIIMTSGMATIAGTMMVLYAAILQTIIPSALGHILTASIISAPAAIAVALLMVPMADNAQQTEVLVQSEASSTMDAISRGTTEGISLLLNIIAMIIVLVALVSLVNIALAWLPTINGQTVSLQIILGWIMAPIAWLMGIPWSQATQAGALLGTKIALNELLAYMDMAKLAPAILNEKSRLIMTYALCGFANFGSLGIMIGGLGAMVPERKADIVNLGLRAIIAGTLATCMTAAIIGMIV